MARFRRDPHDPIILSTLPHFVTLYFSRSHMGYSTIVFLSSSASVFWHRTIESKEDPLYEIDHGLAAIWGAYDVFLALWYFKYSVIALNILNLALYHASANSKNYHTAHSLWHLFSSAKSILVAYILFVR